MLVKVQIMGQNTGNWKYDIKAYDVFINPEYIRYISPCPNKDYEVFFVYLVGTEDRYPLVIDKVSFDNICNQQGGV